MIGAFKYLDKVYFVKDLKTMVALTIYFKVFYKDFLKAELHFDFASMNSIAKNSRFKIKDEVGWVVPHLRKTYPEINFMEI